MKVLTEGLAYELHQATGDRITAHLLVPGFTHTGLTGTDEKPAAVWTAEQVVDYGLEAIGRSEFYILCPDNAVTRETDERRIRWAAEDLILNRPTLSRWRSEYKDTFEAFVARDD